MEIILNNFDLLATLFKYLDLHDIYSLLQINHHWYQQISNLFLESSRFDILLTNFIRPVSPPIIVFNKYGQHNIFTPVHFRYSFYRYILYLISNSPNPLYFNGTVINRINIEIIKNISQVIDTNNLITDSQLILDDTVFYTESLFPNDELLQLVITNGDKKKNSNILKQKGILLRMEENKENEEDNFIIPLTVHENRFYRQAFCYYRMIIHSKLSKESFRHIFFLPGHNPFLKRGKWHRMIDLSTLKHYVRKNYNHRSSCCLRVVENVLCFTNNPISMMCKFNQEGENFIIFQTLDRKNTVRIWPLENKYTIELS